MKTLFTFVALILALGAAGVAGYGYYERTGEVKQLNDTIAELESRIAANKQIFDEFLKQEEQSAESEEVPQAVEKDMASLREKVESVSTRVEVLGTQVSALREYDKKSNVQIARLEKKVSASPSAVVGGGAIRREDIEDLIEEKMKGHQPLGKEPPLAAVTARLGLEDVERKALEDILRQKKNQMMELLQTPRADGGNMLDDFADQIIEVMASGDEQAGKKVFMKFFQRLATDRVPGTDRTYFVDIVKMQQETREAFKQALPEQQFQAFEALGIENPMDIKIDNDPLGAYLQQRMQAQGVTPPGGDQ